MADMFVTTILDKTFIRIPEDLDWMVLSFLKWDKNTLKYAKFRNTNPLIYQTNYNIKNSFSRKDGFGGQLENDTEDEHWAFADNSNSIILQSINCKYCGNYIHSQCPIMFKIKCKCN